MHIITPRMLIVKDNFSFAAPKPQNHFKKQPTRPPLSSKTALSLFGQRTKVERLRTDPKTPPEAFLPLGRRKRGLFSLLETFLLFGFESYLLCERGRGTRPARAERPEGRFGESPRERRSGTKANRGGNRGGAEAPRE